MSRLDSGKFKSFKNAAGRGNDFDYAKYANEHKSFIKEVLNTLGKIECNEYGCPFSISYDDLPPKTSRFIFNINNHPETLDDVRQKSIKTNFNSTQDPEATLYYLISREELKNFIEIIHSWTNESIKKTKSKKSEFAKKLSKIRSINLIKPKPFIPIGKLVKMIYIEEVFEKLKEKEIINNLEYENYLYLNPYQYSELVNLFPWIIIDVKSSEMVLNVPQLNLENIDLLSKKLDISTGQVIGVIDSGLELPAEFADGLDGFEDHREHRLISDKTHGTLVSSIILGHDLMNQTVSDGLKNFKIRHFEVLEPSKSGGQASASFMHLYKKIKEITENNKDIKVWNLSFGGLKKPYDISISPLGFLLDKISSKNEQIFIIASGNDRNEVDNPLESLNTPGDSLNSITVGSVEKLEKPYYGYQTKYSKYSSIGNTIHFIKPEISTFGGPKNQDYTQFSSYNSEVYFHGIEGTSFAAPKITRYIANFINDGLTINEAKAKIIAMSNKELQDYRSSAFGYIDVEDEIEHEFTTTIDIHDKNVYVLPLTLVTGIEEIIISSSNIVSPILSFGEEYSIHSFDVGFIFYDKNSNEPIRDYKSKTISVNGLDREYKKEKIQRMDTGKYFNSTKNVYSKEKIEKAKNEFFEKISNRDPYFKRDDIEFALKVKKTDLFETVKKQVKNISIHIIFKGNFDKNELESLNEAILENTIYTYT